MKYRNLFLLTICLLQAIAVHAQKLTVERMMASSVDLSASQFERKDLAGLACGLVKVQLAAAGAQFEGNIFGQTEYKTGEYWVYMTQGAYMLRIKHPGYVPLDVNFRDFGISGVQSKVTYYLTILKPKNRDNNGDGNLHYLNLTVSPPDSKVFVDGLPRMVGEDGFSSVLLEPGQHSYLVEAENFVTKTGEFVIADETVEECVVLEKRIPVSIATSDSIEVITVNGVSFSMIKVVGGTFMMGNDAYKYEKPVHQVTLSDYLIGETEVTQDLWQTVMGQNPAKFRGKDLPVERVSWDDCQLFISELNRLTGMKFRLPTEAEWEFAARGGTKSRGYQYSGSDNLNDVAWNNSNSSIIHSVKTKKANELGIYDMSGNVLEWCDDIFSKYREILPPNKGKGDKRAARGDSVFTLANDCRVTCRYSLAQSFKDFYLGFRLAR